MHVEIIEGTVGQEPAGAFPPDDDHVDLHANPEAILQIAEARQHLPLRNFLASVNGTESIFVAADVVIQSDFRVADSAAVGEFASQMRIVFASPALNSDPAHYADLCSALKELLERDSSDAVHIVLKISPCVFTEMKANGYCLGVRVAATGSSAQQAELRWGLGLARVQQALLFMSRALKEKVGQ